MYFLYPLQLSRRNLPNVPSQVTDTIVAYICDADTVFMDKRARASSIHLFYRASYVASAVCLALTLLVYNILPSLRNNRNYYVKCYMSHLFVSYICVIAQINMENKQGHTCFQFGYITLFVFLSTLCWLNIICFDIYWKIRYNISINRNTSTSVRTIIYHFYCWGLSSIFVCTGFFFQYSQDQSLQKYAPYFIEDVCFYYNMIGYGRLIFFLIPMCIMLTANLILFLLTAIQCSRIKSKRINFNQTDSKTESFLANKEM
ncbi:G-protein coupled receptor Mth2-like [Acyrthosiphon pisum]|uniref:G-protein coupled receptors family 2 profile 2 domain-containing protein n=1 Tax=Acyrthosiphon pisum TaxID=7029 RepID=A0A8R2JVC4_ACYPI|nr:G-protein coupled receptor Mth2-like [Acyrthosiphon pisum]